MLVLVIGLELVVALEVEGLWVTTKEGNCWVKLRRASWAVAREAGVWTFLLPDNSWASVLESTTTSRFYYGLGRSDRDTMVAHIQRTINNYIVIVWNELCYLLSHQP